MINWQVKLTQSVAFNRHVYCSENSFRVINSNIVSIIDYIGVERWTGPLNMVLQALKFRHQC